MGSGTPSDLLGTLLADSTMTRSIVPPTLGTSYHRGGAGGGEAAA